MRDCAIPDALVNNRRPLPGFACTVARLARRLLDAGRSMPSDPATTMNDQRYRIRSEPFTDGLEWTLSCNDAPLARFATRDGALETARLFVALDRRAGRRAELDEASELPGHGPASNDADERRYG